MNTSHHCGITTNLDGALLTTGVYGSALHVKRIMRLKQMESIFIRPRYTLPDFHGPVSDVTSTSYAVSGVYNPNPNSGSWKTMNLTWCIEILVLSALNVDGICYL